MDNETRNAMGGVMPVWGYPSMTTEKLHYLIEANLELIANSVNKKSASVRHARREIKACKKELVKRGETP